MSRPDPLLEALVVKLGDRVSPKYPGTFLGDDGYALQQRLISQYGYDTLRWSLSYALDKGIVPDRSAYGLVRTLCVRKKSDDAG